MSRENIEASRRVIEEGFSGGNLDVVDEVCSDDFTSHDPIAGEQDAEGVKQSMSGYREAFPDLEVTIEDIFAAGDKVVIRWTAIGTFENEFMGQQPTGERGNPVEGIAIDRFEDGKIAETWAQWDTLGFLRNIGAVPDQAATAG
ncbi:MAG: ester cyclase [Actinomycetota bacterium]